MKKLLVPVDGSECALRAVAYAVELARLAGASIHLLNAYEEPVIYGEIAVYAQGEKIEQFLRQRSESVLEQAAAVVKKSGVPCTTETAVGLVAQQIAGRAESGGCDAIVMGTRGMSAFGDLVLGSVATRVVHATRLPVTLVK